MTKLYGSGRYFLYRPCYGLAYSSQSETELDRTLRKVDKLGRRVGGDPFEALHSPAAARGMWRRTYRRPIDRAIEAECIADGEFARRAAP
ncbi:MAG: hypothetical protein WCA32_11695 [Chromatiaceae bacterium]